MIANISCVYDNTTLPQFFLLFFCFCFVHWIGKRSSPGHLLGHSKSSGTKIITIGPTVCQLQKDIEKKQTKEI